MGVYRVGAPGGVFDAADAGNYLVRLTGALAAANLVVAAPPGGLLGTFEVRPEPLRRRQSAGDRA